VTDGLWIFGYGSLVWRPGFAHTRRRPAWIPGFRRRFWQGSIDHRGRPGAPGRVVTLVREEHPRDIAGPRCWGMAYRVASRDVADVLAVLDHREQGGYERVDTELHLEGAAPVRSPGLMYVATPCNPDYLGPASLEAISEQVLASAGPSGHNAEYVLRLAGALLTIRPDLDPAEEDVLALASRVRAGSRAAPREGGGP
jgi:cation transport regulator ChaC